VCRDWRQLLRLDNVGKSKTVMLKRRKRKRGGIGKRRKKREPSDNKITFDFLNIRGFNSKVRELNRVLDRDNVDFIGLAETFLRSNSRPTKLDDRYE
jgi:hypothetical protein